MDNGYAGLVDQAMLQSPTSYNPYDTLLKPAAGNMQLSGFYDPNARIKCEEGLSDMFSRAAAQLYQKALKFPELSFGSSTTCDLRAIRAPTPSSVPMFDAMDYIASANSFSFLGSSECMPSLHTSVSSSEDKADKHIRHEVEEFRLAGHTGSSTSFSGSVVHSRELFQAASPTLPTTSLPSSTPTLPESSCTAGMPASLHGCSVAPSDVSDMLGSIPDSANSPIKEDSPVQSAEDSDADPKSHNSKRRKAQQKRVVCVPIGGESKQKGEAPPSDLWAWRKYGQKPIKGSPYPRGYYRCSSSKGCSARKQVERSRSDPTMLVVTYTSDHNHPWPANRSSSAASSSRPSPKISNAQSQEETVSCEITGNLFSSIINSPNAVDEQVMPSLDTLQNEESFSLQRDVDLCLSRTTTEEDDVFDDLEELPELSAIFSKGFLEDSLNEEATNSMDFCNPCSISNWATMALINKSGIR